MCDFCNIKSRGDSADESIFEIDLNFGNLGEETLTGLLWQEMDGSEILNIGLAKLDTVIKINYCPMCGRKLKGAKENV